MFRPPGVRPLFVPRLPIRAMLCAFKPLGQDQIAALALEGRPVFGERLGADCARLYFDVLLGAFFFGVQLALLQSLPGIDGLELQSRLAPTGVPIIFITAHADVPRTLDGDGVLVDHRDGPPGRRGRSAGGRRGSLVAHSPV